MSGEKFITQVPYVEGHGHFQNHHISSFPGLPVGPTFQQRQDFIKDSLKYQLLTATPQSVTEGI
jgi:hypothetical protein